ncbi:MAG: hypothetical protein RLZZ440_39 [Planctomycetota bacterium]
MSLTRFLFCRGCSPRVVAFLVAMAVIAAGVGFPPVSLADAAVAVDDEHQPDSQPCEESPDESLEDEESSAGKHSAVLGCELAIAPPVRTGYGVEAFSSRLPAGPRGSSMPIRGPPAAA